MSVFETRGGWRAEAEVHIGKLSRDLEFLAQEARGDI